MSDIPGSVCSAHPSELMVAKPRPRGEGSTPQRRNPQRCPRWEVEGGKYSDWEPQDWCYGHSWLPSLSPSCERGLWEGCSFPGQFLRSGPQRYPDPTKQLWGKGTRQHRRGCQARRARAFGCAGEGWEPVTAQRPQLWIGPQHPHHSRVPSSPSQDEGRGARPARSISSPCHDSGGRQLCRTGMVSAPVTFSSQHLGTFSSLCDALWLQSPGLGPEPHPGV